MADGGENQQRTESRSTEETQRKIRSRNRVENGYNFDFQGLDMSLNSSESSEDQNDHRHQTESRSSENEIRDQKDSDAEIQRSSNIEMQSRSHETESRALPLKNEQEPRMRERITPDSRDRDSRERINGNASVPEVDGPDSNLKPSTDVDMSKQSFQPSPLVPNNNEEPMKDTEIDEEFSDGNFDCWLSETDTFSDEEFDEYSRPVVDIDPEILAALPPDIREEVLAEQRIVRGGPAVTDNATSGLLALQNLQPRTYEPPAVEDIDPEVLAALTPEMREEVLGQQRIVRGEPAVTDIASASTIDPEYLQELPAHLREEILLSCSEANLQALPPHLLAEARILRDRAMVHQLHQQEQRQQQNIEQQRREAQENVQEQTERVEKLSLKAKENVQDQRREAQENVQEPRESVKKLSLKKKKLNYILQEFEELWRTKEDDD